MDLRSLFFIFFTNIAFASPWMTGPLLAPAGKTVPPGHFNFEPYAFYTVYPENFRNFEATPVLTIGLANALDLQASVPYDISWNRGQSANGAGDTSLGFGIQLLRQQDHSWKPDLRLTIQEIFPTGRYNHLNPAKFGTDQTGVGSYQTTIGFNFQRLKSLEGEHYLRTRLSLVAAFASDVKVNGLNTFGGGIDTQGKVRPGNSYSVDLAFEYSLTQNWVPVFEMLFVDSGPSKFGGSPGFTPGGTINAIGGGGGNQGYLAPAIEYNFNAQIGIIFGVWFSITGPHSSEFTSTTLAINYFF